MECRGAETKRSGVGAASGCLPPHARTTRSERASPSTATSAQIIPASLRESASTRLQSGSSSAAMTVNTGAGDLDAGAGGLAQAPEELPPEETRSR